MKLRHFALSLAAVSVLSACNLTDDNDKEVNALEEQVAALQAQLDTLNEASVSDLASLQATADAMQAELSAMETALAALQAQSDASTASESAKCRSFI